MIVDQFLTDLSNEVYYRFGTPWRYSDKSLGVVVPILKRDGIDLEDRVYVTIEEVKDNISFKDTGKIDRVIIESQSEKPVFVRSGTALKGIGTQTRAVETSVVIIPQEEDKQKDEKIPVAPIITRQEIPVRCIYSSKPISRGSKFTYSGDVPLEVRSALISKSGQGETWSAVGHATHRLMSMRSAPSYSSSQTIGANRGSSFGPSFGASHIRSDDLVGVMEEVDKFQSNIDEILKKVPLFEDQVGTVFLDMKDVIGLELFDHPKSWEAIHKEVEKRLGESTAKEEESFFKPDYEKVKPLALEFLKKLLESEKIETSHGITSTVTLKGDGVIGEATTINGKVIHLVGMRHVKSDKEGMGTANTARSMVDTIRMGNIRPYSHSRSRGTISRM